MTSLWYVQKYIPLQHWSRLQTERQELSIHVEHTGGRDALPIHVVKVKLLFHIVAQSFKVQSSDIIFDASSARGSCLHFYKKYCQFEVRYLISTLPKLGLQKSLYLY
jgi:hypothetical protein